jgi:MscS family membrane protein
VKFIIILFFPLWGISQELNQKSPLNTIYSHLYYLQENSYFPNKAAEAFKDFQNDSLKARKDAERLKQIFDGKGIYVRMDLLPSDENYRDSLTNKEIFTPYPNELPSVFLEKVEGKWVYSSQTSSSIPELYKELYPFGSDLFVNLLPSKIGSKKFLGLKVWQYLGILIILLGTYLLYLILSRILRPFIIRFAKIQFGEAILEKKYIWNIARLSSVWLIIKLEKVFIPMLLLQAGTAAAVVLIIQFAGIIILTFLFLNVSDILIQYGKKITEKTESKLDDQLIPIADKLLKGLVIFIGLIQILHLLNVNVTALIAGISIGGLAVALAAQDTIKNLFGSLTIFLDKPFQIGDVIKFSEGEGTVEKVGVRSSRIRTFWNSLIYVPNSILADSIVDNYGLRNYRRFKMMIGVKYDTPPELIELFVEGLRDIIQKHPASRKDFIEVHLHEMNSSSLDILLYTFFAVSTYTEELTARHEILVQLLKLGKSLGVEFAFPSTSLYIEKTNSPNNDLITEG